MLKCSVGGSGQPADNKKRGEGRLGASLFSSVQNQATGGAAQIRLFCDEMGLGGHTGVFNG